MSRSKRGGLIRLTEQPGYPRVKTATQGEIIVLQRIKIIKITKLFNLFDYDIELKEEGITILTGPNGYGKPPS